KYLAPALEGVQPIREPVTQALIDQSQGQASVGILAADIVLGVASGSSQLHIEFGGVNAYTEGEKYANPFSNAASLPNLSSAPVVNNVVSQGQPAVPATVGTAGTAGTPGTPASRGDTFIPSDGSTL